MFKQSRRRIVAAIMSVLTLLWVGTLCVIYVSSYFEVVSSDREMLKEHAKRYMSDDRPQEEYGYFEPLPGKEPHIDPDRFNLSTFYTVELSYSGDVLEIRNDKAEILSDEELSEKAKAVFKEENRSGTIDGLEYYKLDKGGYILVSFMDSTVFRGNMNTLFRYTLIFGGIAIICFYFIAVYIARKIMDPIEESYKKQKQFISDAGHELKTPISVISANADLLYRETGDNQWLSNIQYENERMARLVGQLLDLARTENAKANMENVNISNIIARDTLPFESVAYEKGLELNTNIQEGVTVFGNETQLGQLVCILVDNAIQHTSNGKEVNVELKRIKNECVLSVINAGEPIPENKTAHLFERFYRVDESRNGDSKHYGLGLTIAKAIAESHKGKISVSCYDGKICFSVRIPCNKV